MSEIKTYLIYNETELRKFLDQNIIPGKTILIGLGNELRCDDAFGIFAARTLRNLLDKKNPNLLSCVNVLEGYSFPGAFSDIISDYDFVILIDTVIKSKALSGTLIVITNLNLNEVKAESTHMLDYSLRVKPSSRVMVIGTTPQCLENDIKISPNVGRALGMLIKSLYRTIIAKCLSED